MGEFTGRVCIITGATSGIGTALAVAFAAEGANLILAGRRADRGMEVTKKVETLGVNAKFVETDISVVRDVEKMVNTALEEFGRLDFAVNNAGVEQYFKPLPEQSEKVFDIVMNTNVKGVWMSMQREIPAMLKTGGGAVVNVSSVFGLRGAAYGPLYSASKHAVIGLTKSVALEFAKQNIRVNSVIPGLIDTPMIDRLRAADAKSAEELVSMHPVGRIGKPSEVADVCLWLCSKRASFVTGSAIGVDGGYLAR